MKNLSSDPSVDSLIFIESFTINPFFIVELLFPNKLIFNKLTPLSNQKDILDVNLKCPDMTIKTQNHLPYFRIQFSTTSSVIPKLFAIILIGTQFLFKFTALFIFSRILPSFLPSFIPSFLYPSA